jgi:hypothetical protein
MFSRIPESDWRRFKELHHDLMERFCADVLEELAAIARSADDSAHERYLRVYKLIKERDKELARAFDPFSRSKAVMQLVTMRHMGLLTDDELGGFSEQTQEEVRRFEPLGRD